jgi:hypothetical protein
MERVLPQSARHTDCRRMSVFTEVGLVDEQKIQEERSPVRAHGETLKRLRPVKILRFRSHNDVFDQRGEDREDDEDEWESIYDEDEADDSIPSMTTSATQTFMPTRLYRLGLLSLLLALMLPIIQINPLKHIGVRAGAVPAELIRANAERSVLVRREDSPTDACRRWSGQSAIVNGTLYMYGFRRTTEAQQKDNTWSMFSSFYSSRTWHSANFA